MRPSTVMTIVLLMLFADATAAVAFFQSGRFRMDTSWLALARKVDANCEVSTLRAIQPRDAGLIEIPAGTVQIGDDAGWPDELPAFHYTSSVFRMDRTPVTVAEFAAFVKDTRNETEAERYGSGGVLDKKEGTWVAVKGADWRHPTGPKGSVAQWNHPVTQVSWNDANAFCRAYSTRLPTEFEWERAARMGQTPDGHVFKRGDPIEHHGRDLVNAYEGTFPVLDTGADGYRTTSPVGAFGTAPSGLTDMAGNVWEWTSSWYLRYGRHNENPRWERANAYPGEGRSCARRRSAKAITPVRAITPRRILRSKTSDSAARRIQDMSRGWPDV